MVKMMMMVKEYFPVEVFLYFYHFLETTTSKLVEIESWFLRDDMLYKYECEHIDENNRTHPR